MRELFDHIYAVYRKSPPISKLLDYIGYSSWTSKISVWTIPSSGHIRLDLSQYAHPEIRLALRPPDAIDLARRLLNAAAESSDTVKNEKAD